MKLYLISGFLGSGKTTTIINWCKYLMKSGKKVGVVTNDQGKYLVDTAFIKASDIPAVDVQSGCFCSNYQDLVEQLDELNKTVDPDIVFAESIGSAGNLVGTVLKPLLEHSKYSPDALISLVDSRLLFRLLQDKHLPFSDSVTATFKSQLMESDSLIINKIDLLSSIDKDKIIKLIPTQFNDKDFLFQSAFTPGDIEASYRFISGVKTMVKEDILFDQLLHQKALDRLEWSEDIFDLKSDENVRFEIKKIINEILENIKATQSTVAHIKILIESSETSLKLSITGLDKDSWRKELQGFEAKEAKVIINSRIQK